MLASDFLEESIIVRMRRWAAAGFLLTSVGLATIGLGPTASAQGAAPYAPTYSQLPTFPFGNAMSTCGPTSSTGTRSNAPIVAIALTSNNAGCWMTGSDGGVFTHGDAPFYGSMGGKALSAPIVGMATTANDHGYWLVAADGGIFSFGDAKFHGSMGGKALNASIVGLALDPATGGYWEVASDGGVFSFDAPFYGSMGGKPLNQPIVGMAATPGGGGYWLVAADGGIFSFGDAKFHGSMGGKALNASIVGMALDPATGGYWEVASDGGVFSFDAPFYGSMARGPQPNPITAIAASPEGGGYLLMPTDPAVEPGVPGRSGFDLARQEWVGDGTLACYQENAPLRQGAHYLLIGESVDGGNTSGYPAAIKAFEQLDTLPETNNTPAQNAERVRDTHTLNAFFATNTGGTCA
ncbi:MAG: hypothetical protein ACYDEY_11960 [Acidimicrobiales bacterium]